MRNNKKYLFNAYNMNNNVKSFLFCLRLYIPYLCIAFQNQ